MIFIHFLVFALHFINVELEDVNNINIYVDVKDDKEELTPHIYNQELDEHISAKKVIDNVVGFYRSHVHTPRVKELIEKLKTIDSYVVDQEKYGELLLNVTKDTDLNSTNFFDALKENDHYRFLERNNFKNVYLKFKEKMNRDDIDKILVDNKKKTANRRTLVDDTKEILLDDVVDKIIGETAKDDHKFNASVKDSMYWDPQEELEQLNEFHKHDGRRIFKGERTNIKHYPFIVSVHVMRRFWCGGTLYASDLVVTSASCLQLMHNNRFFRENPKAVFVKVGSNHSRIGGEDVPGLEVYFHPSYEPKTLRHNIAIIRLERHLQFSYHRVPKVIGISHEHGLLPDTVEILVLGWGVKKMSQKLAYEPVYLQRKFLPVYPNQFCKEVYGKSFITDSMFCAGTMTTGEGACDHDAGGPAILAGKLVGIISFGPTLCGYPSVPTVFTLVGAYDDWLETIRDSIPSYVVGRGLTSTTMTPVTLSDFTIPEHQYHFVPFTPIAPHHKSTDRIRDIVNVEEVSSITKETTTEIPSTTSAAGEETTTKGGSLTDGYEPQKGMKKKKARGSDDSIQLLNKFDDGWSIDFKK